MLRDKQDFGLENENDTNQTFSNQTINKHHLGWEDRSTFRNLAIGSVALGLVSTLLFHSTIWSKDLVNNAEKAEKTEEKEQNWRKWFKRAQFYSITGFGLSFQQS